MKTEEIGLSNEKEVHYKLSLAKCGAFANTIEKYTIM